MNEPSLADKFAILHSYDEINITLLFAGNRERILEDLRIAELVRSVGENDETNPTATDLALACSTRDEYEVVDVCSAILEIVKRK